LVHAYRELGFHMNLRDSDITEGRDVRLGGFQEKRGVESFEVRMVAAVANNIRIERQMERIWCRIRNALVGYLEGGLVQFPLGLLLATDIDSAAG